MRRKSIVVWNNHPELEGRHAFLGGSNYHWLNDDEEKLIKRYEAMRAKDLGTELHEIAATLIKHRLKLKDDQTTLGLYVNDAIDFRMRAEQRLCYSDVCFGTADAICFRDDLSLLRIHDLKTGTHPCDVRQLMIYAAIFCLEQQINPNDISFELRIYQNNEYKQWNPSSDDIAVICSAIRRNSKIILNKKKQEE